MLREEVRIESAALLFRGAVTLIAQFDSRPGPDTPIDIAQPGSSVLSARNVRAPGAVYFSQSRLRTAATSTQINSRSAQVGRIASTVKPVIAD
jgi:hypothetical protein